MFFLEFPERRLQLSSWKEAYDPFRRLENSTLFNFNQPPFPTTVLSRIGTSSTIVFSAGKLEASANSRPLKIECELFAAFVPLFLLVACLCKASAFEQPYFPSYSSSFASPPGGPIWLSDLTALRGFKRLHSNGLPTRINVFPRQSNATNTTCPEGTFERDLGYCVPNNGTCCNTGCGLFCFKP